MLSDAVGLSDDMMFSDARIALDDRNVILHCNFFISVTHLPSLPLTRLMYGLRIILIIMRNLLRKLCRSDLDMLDFLKLNKLLILLIQHTYLHVFQGVFFQANFKPEDHVKLLCL